MPEHITMISDLLNIPGRFLRSVQLEKDFYDPASLENYIVTPAMAAALTRVADGLREGSQRRAWRVTGDYGVGKSSFALALAHLLSGSRSVDAERIEDAIGWPTGKTGKQKLLPILITGSREGLLQALVRGVRDSAQLLSKQYPDLSWSEIEKSAVQCDARGTTRSLEKLIETLRAQAAEYGLGLLLVVDELGKLLEYAALNPDSEDVFALQRLAELASRSTDRPFVLMGLLHQGFQAYADRLPSSVRHEWDKVAGRFEEIVFDQPLAHTAALVSGALGIRREALPAAVSVAARHAADVTSAMGWLGGATTQAGTLDAARLYPIHPTLLPPLVRFFAQFGQSERSLFGFLLSSEPFGLQAFSQTTPCGAAWYNLANFYDYVRAAFGHRLSGSNYQNQWLRIVSTIDAATVEASALHEQLLKAVGILNLLGSDDLVANDRALLACFSTADSSSVVTALQDLTDRGLLFKRGERGGYRLWPNSSVNLNAAMNNARRAVGTVEAVSSQLGRYLEPQMILARRHYLERGTMRYFEVRYALADDLEPVANRPTEADGVVILCLSDSKDEQASAKRAAVKPSVADAGTVLVGVLPPLWHLAAELLDVKLWQWVEDNTPELDSDDFAAAEVLRQLSRAKLALSQRFNEVTAILGGPSEIEWIYGGNPFAVTGTVPNTLSELCDRLFPDAPRITNELLNRNALSSPAASARMRLIEGLFNAANSPLLGIDEKKSPPEKSMYLSVLSRGLVHVSGSDRHELKLPEAGSDPLHLRPALLEILRIIVGGRGHRVPVSDILGSLKRAPFGVRDGVAPLLLAIIMKAQGHEFAVYENGTFLPKFGAMEFLRLTKSVGVFEIQHCSVEGVRSDVFARLAEIFAKDIHHRRPVLLDVVTELCQFAAKLPEFTRKSRQLSPTAQAVRDALLSAREPATLLFNDLPAACGLSAFEIGKEQNASAVEIFVAHLNDATHELQNAYTELLERIILRVGEAIRQDSFDRAGLAARAARVSLAAREPRLRAFAFRLRDPGLSDDAWAEALASFVVSRPPARWAPGDEARFGEEIGALCEIFAKVEGAAFHSSDVRPDVNAVRLNLTRGDGTDLVQIIHPVSLTEIDERAAMALSDWLPQGDAQRLQVLTNLLWKELEKSSYVGADEQLTTTRTSSSE